MEHEEQSTSEQKQQVDADTASARELAAARAEDVQRRTNMERENTADALRTQETAERRAKNSRQKERRRAEIYAINAVMRWVHGLRSEPAFRLTDFVFTCVAASLTTPPLDEMLTPAETSCPVLACTPRSNSHR